MYKIVITNLENQILEQEYHLTLPSQETVELAVYEALEKYLALVRVRVEVVKYIDMGKAA